MLRFDESTPFATMGDMLCLTTKVFAAVICAGVALGFLYSASEGDPTIQIVALILAGVIWFIGRACRYVLAGH